ncbi:MAG: lipase maturation factor family protein [Methylotetracoccus sp.]
MFEARDEWPSVVKAEANRPDVRVAWLFVRLLGLIYVAAFASLSVQITGLVGQDGILSVTAYLDAALAQHGHAAYWQLPTLFWFDESDAALVGACFAGIAAAILVVLGVFETLGLVASYVLYLSLVVAGQDFTSFQWDLLLLESGFLAIFLRLHPLLVAWLFRWLLARYMFMSGVVKLASGDPAWRNLDALSYHFETQPLPSPLAWWAHQLPDAVLRAATASALVIELVLPFFIVLGRRLRLTAALGFVVLQVSIMLTGNFTFFNLLTVALCVFLLDDRDLQGLPGRRQLVGSRSPGMLATAAASALSVGVISACAGLLWIGARVGPPPAPLAWLARTASTFGIVNGYGPFAVMTTERSEIVIEGSNDGVDWREYPFRYKPGDPARPLVWLIPHQPRLDWQMWFAALPGGFHTRWFPRLLQRLRDRTPAVMGLLESNPFADGGPRLLRAVLFRYSFTDPDERRADGRIWRRERLGPYPPIP